MIPSWAVTAFICLAGCILAYIIGISLPYYSVNVHGVDLQVYILIVAIVCTIGAVTNNFPMLMGIGSWMPITLPLASLSMFPVYVLILGWITVVLFFRICLKGTLSYMRSFTLYLLVVFAWVPIRFLMNPVHKFGGSVEGGSGVSGISPYFYYVVAAGTLVILGAILNTREKILSYMIWCLRMVFFVGMGFLICAFIPSTAPFFYTWGVFAAGGMGDNLIRFVQLPLYGFFLVQAAMCPNLFRLTWKQSAMLLVLGLAMMVVGGNRQTIAGAVLALPVLLMLRRSTHVLAVCIGAGILGVIMLRLTVENESQGEISPLLRSFGMFDSKIDAASGGDASADWRYQLWQSGMEKIMEHPIVGKGFGNLPKHLDPTSAEVQGSTDFEVILAGGLAHNGFISAAYGFGIPFMLALTAGLAHRFFRQVRMALTADRHDKELRDLHALLASMYPAYFVFISTSFDMSVACLWIYVGLGLILEQLRRGSSAGDSAPTTAQPAAPYLYPSRY